MKKILLSLILPPNIVLAADLVCMAIVIQIN